MAKQPIASIDVGAHSVRMLIAEVDKSGDSFEPLEDLELPVPLGSNVFQKGRISNKSIGILCEIFRNFRRKMEEYGVERYKAIATSAVREALNGNIFIERIRHATGIELSIFEGSDEARLDYLTVREDVPAKYGFLDRHTLIADIGTGACQVSLYEAGSICFTETIRIGTLRALESLPETVSPGSLAGFLSPLVRKAFSELEHTSHKLHAETLIVMGGTVRALIQLSKKSRRNSRAVSLSRQEFNEIYALAASMGQEELCEKSGVRSELAEAIIPCCLIVDNLLRLTGASGLVIPMTSTKYALMRDFINESMMGKDYFEPQIFEAVRRIAGKYLCDNDYSRRVVEMSGILFESLSELHGLSRRELLLLKVAAHLHKSGLFINNQAYHKHSYYLISNTEIPGISHCERHLVAHIARYHRKSYPKSQHPEYVALTPQSRACVNKLSSILRLACALASAGAEPDRISVKVAQSSVTFGLEGRPGELSDNALLPPDADHFNHVFARRVVFE